MEIIFIDYLYILVNDGQLIYNSEIGKNWNKIGNRMNLRRLLREHKNSCNMCTG